MRPEYVTLADVGAPGALPAIVTQAQDIGTYWLVSAQVGSGDDAALIRARLSPTQAIPKTGDLVWLGIAGKHTCLYRNDVLISEGAP